jgi:plastocyanin
VRKITVLFTIAVVLGPTAIVGCSDDNAAKPATSTTTSLPVASADPMLPNNKGAGGCPSRMPGELLLAEEAVVKFTPESVCPGYVTVLPGTPVTWQNNGKESATVTVTRSDNGDAVVTFDLAAGATHVVPFDTAGTFLYRVSSLPAFTGTVEARAA